MTQIRERSAAADTRPKQRSSVGVGVAATVASNARAGLRMSSRHLGATTTRGPFRAGSSAAAVRRSPQRTAFRKPVGRLGDRSSSGSGDWTSSTSPRRRGSSRRGSTVMRRAQRFVLEPRCAGGMIQAARAHRLMGGDGEPDRVRAVRRTWAGGGRDSMMRLPGRAHGRHSDRARRPALTACHAMRAVCSSRRDCRPRARRSRRRLVSRSFGREKHWSTSASPSRQSLIDAGSRARRPLIGGVEHDSPGRSASTTR